MRSYLSQKKLFSEWCYSTRGIKFEPENDNSMVAWQPAFQAVGVAIDETEV